MGGVNQEAESDVLDRIGVLRVARLLTRASPKILMYHRFAAHNEPWAIGRDAFEKQLSYLRKHYNLMTISELARRAKAGILDANSAAITVDDCYQDFYAHAWPLLKRHGVPATVYAVSGFVSRRTWLWPDVIRYILGKTSRVDAEVHFSHKSFRLSMTDVDRREMSWNVLADECLLLENEERIQLIRELAIQLNVKVPELPVGGFQAMTWSQLKEIDRGGSEVGSHTVNHPRLTSLTLDRARIEIQESKLEIEHEVGSEVTAFCYPNGTAKDYNEHIKSIVLQCGYENATTSVKPAGFKLDLFEIGRIGAEPSLRRFRRSVSGLTQLAAITRAAGYHPNNRTLKN